MFGLLFMFVLFEVVEIMFVVLVFDIVFDCFIFEEGVFKNVLFLAFLEKDVFDTFFDGWK